MNSLNNQRDATFPANPAYHCDSQSRNIRYNHFLPTKICTAIAPASLVPAYGVGDGRTVHPVHVFSYVEVAHILDVVWSGVVVVVASHTMVTKAMEVLYAQVKILQQEDVVGGGDH